VCSGAMQSLYRQRPDVEAKFVSLELWKGRLALVAQVVFLLLIVGLVVTAIICALRGHYAIAPVIGGPGAVGGALAAVSSRKSE
jgi:hypothetical protein